MAIQILSGSPLSKSSPSGGSSSGSIAPATSGYTPAGVQILSNSPVGKSNTVKLSQTNPIKPVTQAPVKQVTPVAKQQQSQTTLQKIERIGSQIMQGAQMVGQDVANAVKGIFTPSGGKPQPIKLPANLNLPKLTTAQVKAISNINPGQTLPGYNPTVQAPQQPALVTSGKKNTPVPTPNIIDNLFSNPQTFLKSVGIQPPNDTNYPVTKQIISGVQDLLKGIVPNLNQVAPRSEYMSQQSYNQAVKNETHPTLGSQVNQFLGTQVVFAPAALVGGWLVDPVTESLAALVPAGRGILSNILSVAAKGAIKAVPYGLLNATAPAKNNQQRLVNTAIGVSSAAAIGMGLAGADAIGSELVQKFGQDAESFLANRDLIQNVVNGKATPQELKQFNVLNDTGLSAQAARSPQGISVTTQTPKQGKMWDILRYMFSKPFTPSGAAKTTPTESEPASTETKAPSELHSGTMEFTPQQAQATVIGSDLENTPAGKAILKSSVQAQQMGQSVEVTLEKGGKSDLTTPGGVSITNIGIVTPSEAALGTEATNSSSQQKQTSETPNETASVASTTPTTTNEQEPNSTRVQRQVLPLENPERYTGVKAAHATITPDGVGTIHVELDPPVQGHGQGAAIVKQLESQLQEKGITQVHIKAFTEAQGFWKKQGYKVVPGTTAQRGLISMEKTLSVTPALDKITAKVKADPTNIEPAAKDAIDKITNTQNFAQFVVNIKDLSEKYGGEFTELYDKIQSGEINGQTYDKFKANLKGRIQAVQDNAAQNTGSQAGQSDVANSENAITEDNTTGRGSNDEQRVSQGQPKSVDTGAGTHGSNNTEAIERSNDTGNNQGRSGLVLADTIEKRVDKVFRLMGNSLKEINVIGSTARGKVNPNDLDLLFTPTKPLPELTSDKLYDRMALEKTIKNEIKEYFPGEKLHIVISQYDQARGEKIPLSQFLERYNQKLDIGEPEGNQARPSSTTLRAEVIPGLSKLFEEDILPTLKTVKDAATQTSDFINPPRANEKANRASNIVRQALAKVENYESFVDARNKQYRKFFSKYSDDQNIKNISEYERTGEFPAQPHTPKGQPTYSQLYHDSMTDSYRMIKEAYGNDNEGFIDNYVRRAFVFDNPEEEAKGIQELSHFTRSLSGNKSSLKQRVLDMPLDEAFKDMQGRGIKVKMASTNPEELRQWSLVNAKRLVVYKGAWNDLKVSGLIKFVSRGGDRPVGFVALQDRAAEVFAPAEIHYGIEGETSEKGFQSAVPMGKYYADPTIARILNNVISRGLEDINLFKAARMIGNQMNSFQLGFSAFHLTGSAINAGFSDMALGLRNYIQGKPIQGTGKIIRGMIPGASFMRDVYHGRKFMKDLMKDDPRAAEIIEKYINPAGGRIVRDKKYNDAMWDRMRKSFANGNIIGGLLKLPSGLVEGVAHPLLGYAIPRVKIGAFLDLAYSRMERLPADATDDQRQTALAGAWNSIDNRFGQLVYSNLFWNKVGKDIAMLTTRSVGWNLGDLRELGGGMIIDPIKTMLGGKERVANNAGERITDRMLFATSLILGTSVLGAIYQYLHTGEAPSELKDYFFPKDGGTDTAGNSTRRSLPTYWKDVYAFSQNPLSTIQNKMSPGLSEFMELWNNKDYYGNLIRNPNDPVATQLEQAGSYLLQNIMPFSIQSALQGNQSVEQRVEGFLGITKAPASVIQSDKQKAMIQAYQNQVGLPAPKTPEQEATQALKTKAYAEIKQNGYRNSPTFKELIANGTLNTPRKQVLFVKNAQKTSMQRMIKSLPKSERKKFQ